MSVAFSHPLARDAKIWDTGGLNGQASRILVIITTLQLDRTHKGFKADKVERLTGAARDWLKDHALEAGEFVLVNRPRDWD